MITTNAILCSLLAFQLYFYFVFADYAPCLGYNSENNSCVFCNYDSYAGVFNISSPFDISVCNKKNVSLQNQEVFRSVLVTNQPTITPNANFDSIYVDLVDCFASESQIVSSYYNSSIIIYLTKGAHIAKSETNQAYFRRSLTNITIIPLYCDYFDEPEICVGKNEKIHIILKKLFTFYISKSLKISGIIFDGSDLSLSSISVNEINRNALAACQNSLSVCCNEAFYGNVFESEDADLGSLCGVKGRKFALPAKNLAFFNLEVVYDVETAVLLPVVVLEKCDFINYFSPDFVNLFISLENFGQIIIIKCIFVDTILPNGFFNQKNAMTLSVYKNSRGEKNYNSKEIATILLNQSLFICQDSYFYYKNSVFIEFEEKDQINIVLFSFLQWSSSSQINNCSFFGSVDGGNSIVNSIFTLFEVSNQQITLSKINIIGFNCDFLTINNGVLYLNDATFSNISVVSGNLIDIQATKASVQNISFIFCDNPNGYEYFYVSSSMIVLSDISFTESANIASFFQISDLEITGLFCKDSFFHPVGLYFFNQDMIIKNITFQNVWGDFQFFTISNSNLTLIKKGYFTSIKNQFFLKPITASAFFFLVDCSFTNNITIDYFVAINTILTSITFRRNIFWNNSIAIYAFSVLNLAFFEVKQNYFKDDYYAINVNLFIFQIFEGYFLMSDNVFDNLTFPNDYLALFDIELCISTSINNTFITTNVDPLTDGMFLCYWQVFEAFIDSCNFILANHGFTQAYLNSEDAIRSLIVKNCYFVTLQSSKEFVSNAFYSSGAPIMILDSNFFVNFNGDLAASDIRTIVGPISFQGVSSFSSAYNDLSLEITSNTFMNCSSLYGGVIGILNYNKTFIFNITTYNSQSIFGGSIFLLNCFSIVLQHSRFSHAYAERGSSIFIKNSDSFAIISSDFNTSVGSLSGMLEIKNVKSIQINETAFSNSFSKRNCGCICLFNSYLFLNNVSFENSQSFMYGGVIFINEIANLSLVNVVANVSLSDLDGGFIYAESARVISLDSCLIMNSFSKSNAGGLFINDIWSFNINNVKFISCEASLNGILFFISLQESSVFKIDNLLCFKNKAKIGSCIFYSTPTNLKIEKIDCFENYGTLFQFEYVYSTQISLITGNISNNNIAEFIFSVSNVRIIFQNITLFNNSVCLQSFHFENAISEFEFGYFDNSMNFLCFENESNEQISMIKGIFASLIFSNILFTNNIFVMEKSLVTFLVVEKCNFSLLNSAIKQNINQKNGLIQLEDSSSLIEKCFFQRNIGPVINLADSSLDLNANFFGENFAESPNPNDLFISKVKRQQQTNFKHFNSINCTFENSYGISIIITNFELILILDTKFIGLSSNNSNGMIFTDCSNTTIEKTVFFSFSSTQGSAITGTFENTNSLENVHFYLVKSEIIECESYFGGSLFFSGIGVNLTLDNNLFVNNSAIFNNKNGDVGVITFLNSFGNMSMFTMLNNTFENNHARIFSNAYSNIQIKESGNKYLNNSADIQIEKSLSFPPYKIEIFINSSNFLQEINENSITNISSGDPFMLDLNLIDCLNQTLSYDNISSASIIVAENELEKLNIQKVENNIAICRSGQFAFNKLTVKAKPNITFGLDLKILFSDLFQTDFYLKTTLKFHTRACIVGEILSLDNQCQQCPVNYFSLEDPEKIYTHKPCSSCLEDCFCPGGKSIIPLEGYWRTSSTSLIINACIVDIYCTFLPDGVTKEEVIKNLIFYENQEDILKGSCRNGHTKNLCHECILGYGKYSNGAPCQECKEYNEWAIFRIVLIVIIVLIYLIVNTREMTANKESSLFNEISKIFINHLQKISVVSFLDLNYMMEDLKNFLSFLNTINFLKEDIFSNDCFIQYFVEDNQRYNFYIIKVFITLILPIFLGMLSIVILSSYSFYKKYIKKRENSELFQKIFLVFLIATFIFYPLITKCSLSLLNCITLDSSGEQYMYSSPNLVCWSFDHYLYFFLFGFIGIFFFGLGFPVFIYYMIKRQKQSERKRMYSTTKKQDSNELFVRQETRNRAIMDKQGNFLLFFYKEYKSNCFFWETVIFFQKFLLTLLSNLNQWVTIEVKNLLFFLILFCYVYMFLNNYPFKRNYINYLEINSNVTNIITKICLIMSSSLLISESAKYVFMVMQLVFNVFFFFHMAFIIIKYTQWKALFKKSVGGIKNLKTQLKKISSSRAASKIKT